MSRDWLNLTWSEKTLGERVQTVLSFSMAVVVALVMFGVGLGVLLDSLDGVGRYNAERHSCLEKASNGLEIEQCR